MCVGIVNKGVHHGMMDKLNKLGSVNLKSSILSKFVFIGSIFLEFFKFPESVNGKTLVIFSMIILENVSGFIFWSAFISSFVGTTCIWFIKSFISFSRYRLQLAP